MHPGPRGTSPQSKGHQVAILSLSGAAPVPKAHSELQARRGAPLRLLPALCCERAKGD